MQVHDEVYLKKLNAHELGFRGGRPGGAGPYVYVSKGCARFFPPLSDAVENDQAVLYVVPASAPDKIVLTSFVYHNSKLVHNQPGGRNEYRIYLNNEIHPEGSYFRADDIIVFLQYPAPEMPVYRTVRLRRALAPVKYDLADRILEEHRLRGSDAIVPLSSIASILGALTIELPAKKVIPDDTVKKVLESPATVVAPERVSAESPRIIRSTSFRDLVLFFYNSKCAITGNSILHQDLCNLEAAHIRPKHKQGPDHPANGLALTRDLHWAFDLGFFTINDSLRVEVHEEAKVQTVLADLNSRLLRVPHDPRACPKPDFIRWHRENVFGKFTKRAVEGYDRL